MPALGSADITTSSEGGGGDLCGDPDVLLPLASMSLCDVLAFPTTPITRPVADLGEEVDDDDDKAPGEVGMDGGGE